MSNKTTKTNHQTGWHKRVVNPTTNYPMDSHKKFCKRCYEINHNICPVTKTEAKSGGCSI